MKALQKLNTYLHFIQVIVVKQTNMLTLTVYRMQHIRIYMKKQQLCEISAIYTRVCKEQIES